MSVCQLISLSVYKSKIYSNTMHFFAKLFIIEVKLHAIKLYKNQMQAYKLHGETSWYLGYSKASVTVFSGV